MSIESYLMTHNTKSYLIKNSLQFLIGASMLIALGQPVDYSKLLISLLGFLLAYQSTYHLNDIWDFYEDSKNKFKRRLKPFARGEISTEIVVSKMFILMLFGLSISFLVDNFFGILVSVMLFLSFFHSYKPLNIKRTPAGLANMFFIQSIKFSCGWFAIGGQLNNFPYLIPIFMSAIYVLGYHTYKNEFHKDSLTKNRSLILASIFLIFYTASFYFYKEIRIPLISILPVFVFPYLITMNVGMQEKVKNISLMNSFVMVIFVLLNLLSPYEPIHSISLWLANLF